MNIGAHHIITYVASHYGVTVDDLLGARRNADIVRKRHIAIWLCCRLLPHFTITMIARAFDRDHTTIIHAHKAITIAAESDLVLCQEIEELSHEILKTDIPLDTTGPRAVQAAKDLADALRIALISAATSDPEGFLKRSMNILADREAA